MQLVYINILPASSLVLFAPFPVWSVPATQMSVHAHTYMFTHLYILLALLHMHMLMILSHAASTITFCCCIVYIGVFFSVFFFILASLLKNYILMQVCFDTGDSLPWYNHLGWLGVNNQLSVCLLATTKERAWDLVGPRGGHNPHLCQF